MGHSPQETRYSSQDAAQEELQRKEQAKAKLTRWRELFRQPELTQAERFEFIELTTRTLVERYPKRFANLSGILQKIGRAQKKGEENLTMLSATLLKTHAIPVTVTERQANIRGKIAKRNVGYVLAEDAQLAQDLLTNEPELQKFAVTSIGVAYGPNPAEIPRLSRLIRSGDYTFVGPEIGRRYRYSKLLHDSPVTIYEYKNPRGRSLLIAKEDAPALRAHVSRPKGRQSN